MPTRSCRIQPNPLCGQRIDSDRMPIQLALKRRPSRIVTQSSQHDSQSVIAKIGLRQSGSYIVADRLTPFPKPLFHLIEPVVAFGQDEREPHHDDCTWASTLPVSMGHKMLIDQPGDIHLALPSQQERQIVHPFIRYHSICVHSGTIARFRFST